MRNRVPARATFSLSNGSAPAGAGREQWPMPAYVAPREQLMVEVYVRNLQASSAFYRHLGFEVVRQEEGFMELQWDSVPFALKALPDAPPPLPHPVGTLRIMVPDVDVSWRLVQQLEAPVLWPIADRAYGLRDFTIVGPDGIGICFATRLPDCQDTAVP